MIVFDLVCENDHEFEGWFKDNSEFVSQQENGLLTCPICNTENVVKVLSPSRINLGKKESQLKQLSSIQQNATQLAQQISDFVVNNFEDVGKDFTDLAKKMHYGEETERNIRGVATEEQANELHDEGIDVISLPIVGKKEKDKLN